MTDFLSTRPFCQNITVIVIIKFHVNDVTAAHYPLRITRKPKRQWPVALRPRGVDVRHMASGSAHDSPALRKGWSH